MLVTYDIIVGFLENHGTWGYSMAGKKLDIDLDSMVGYRLRRAQIAYFEDFTATCAGEGVTPGLFGILAVVINEPGLTQRAVSEAIHIDRSSMVSAIDKLENMNLVERRPSQHDRRSYGLYITSEGKKFTQRLYKKVLVHESHFDRLMNTQEKAVMLDLLGRIIADR